MELLRPEHRILLSNAGLPITSPNNPKVLAMWTMDDISGSTMFDGSVNGHDATLNGVGIVAGVLGDAIDIVPNDTVVMDSLASSPIRAVSAWINTPRSDSYYFFNTGHTQGSTYCALLFNASGKFLLDYGGANPGGALAVSTDATFSANVWHHVVVQTTGSAIEIYVGSVLQAVTVVLGSDDGRFFPEATATTFASMGSARRDVTLFRTGKQDQTFLYDTPLTQGEINELFAEVA